MSGVMIDKSELERMRDTMLQSAQAIDNILRQQTAGDSSPAPTKGSKIKELRAQGKSSRRKYYENKKAQ